MTATLGTAAISRATIRVPRYGAWTAEVTITDDTVLSGQQLLTVGDLQLLGTITTGGAFGGTTTYAVTGGAAAWSTTIDEQPYHDDSGVLLSRVLTDLATATGEIGVAPGGGDRSVGLDWTRPAGNARDQLDALTGGQWWIAPDGMTHTGPRPSGAASSPSFTVGPFDPALRRLVVRSADDTIASLLPGATLTTQGLPAPLVIAATTIHVSDQTVEVEVWGEATSAELLRRVVGALTAGTLYHRAMPYTVETVASDGRVAVQPGDGRAEGFPAAPLLAHAPGLPGASYTLQPGAGVLVVYVAGDPGSPIVAGHMPGTLPLTVAIDAVTSITLGGAGAMPLARADKVDAALGAIITALASHSITVPTIGTTGCAKARGE